MLGKFIKKMEDKNLKVLSIQKDLFNEDCYEFILQSKNETVILPSFFDNEMVIDFKEKTIKTSLNISLFLSLTKIVSNHLNLN